MKCRTARQFTAFEDNHIAPSHQREMICDACAADTAADNDDAGVGGELGGSGVGLFGDWVMGE